MNVKIRRCEMSDLDSLVNVYLDCFHGMEDPKLVKKWFECNFNAYPRMQYFVAELEGKVVGYILWIEKGGFRKEAVWELEQIGVLSEYRGRGIGTKLILESLKEIKEQLKKRGSRLKLVEVTTGTHQKAQRLYEKTLGAKAECVIKNLFRGDEVVMVARFEQ